jgi:hypothetical protein
MDEFIGTTSIGPSSPYLGNIPICSYVSKRKEKRLKNKDAIFFSPLKISGTDI